MISASSTIQLRDVCQQLDRADAAYGPKQAQALFSLLAEVESAQNGAELQALYAGSMTIGRDSLLIVFAPQCAAEFEVVKAASTLGSGQEMAKVGRLKLTKIEIGADG
jgi:hypothetical protein